VPASTAEQDPESHDFDTKIKNYPIQILKSIEDFSLTHDGNRYVMATVTDAKSILVSTLQKRQGTE